MQTADVTVRLKAQDGTWETAGRDRYPRVVAESVTYSSNRAGPETCSFVLRRNTEDFHPDLTAFTPCEIEIGGMVVWYGRVKEAPTQEGPDAQIAVTGEGMQFHLDDDLYQVVYAHTRVSDYQDMRTMPTAQLGIDKLNAAGQVSSANGVIQLAWPNATPLVPGATVGVILDLGPNSGTARISIDWESSNNTPALTLYARGSDYANNDPSQGWNASWCSDATTAVMNTGATGTSAGDFNQFRRYVHIFIFNPSFTGTTGADHWFKLKNIRVFTDKTFEGGGISVLRASSVLKDAITRGTKLLQVPTIASMSFQNEVLSADSIKQAFFFDETTGTTAVDAVNPINNGTYANVTLGQAGLLQDEPNDKSVSFVKAFVPSMSAPQVLTGTPGVNGIGHTLEVVFNTGTLPQTNGVIISSGVALSNNGWGLQIGDAAGTGSGSKLLLPIWGVAYYDTGFTLAPNTTYHVIASYAYNSIARVVVNGTLVYWSGVAAQIISLGAGGFFVGNLQAGNATYGFTGLVSFAATYQRTLGPGEEQEHYKAALNRATGTIARTNFNIPEFKAGDSTSPQTPREVADAVNALHDYQLKIAEDQSVIYRPLPSIPLLEVGPWAGAKFQDATAGSAEDVYNRCLVTGTGPDGLPVWVDRYASQLSGATFVTAEGQVNNPNFTDPVFGTVGWNPITSTITRDTTLFDTSPASGRWDNTGASDALGAYDAIEVPNNGVFKAGRVYKLTFKIRSSSAVSPIITVRWGDLTVPDFGFVEAPGAVVAPGNVAGGPAGTQTVGSIPAGSWLPVTVTWSPRADTTIAKLRLDVVINTGGGYFRLDSVDVALAVGTVVDRQGFVRTKSLPTQSAINSVVGTQLANIFLAGHSTTPLKGSLSVAGTGGVRAVTGGNAVPPHALGPYTGELIRIAHLIDPDTGGLGRDGRIAAVSYDHGSRAASISVDNQRGNFEAFVARLAVVTGSAIQT